MVTLDRLLPFAATAFVLIVIFGPSVLFVIGRALAHGRRAALATVRGNASGVYLQAVGVGSASERSFSDPSPSSPSFVLPARSTSSSSECMPS